MTLLEKAAHYQATCQPSSPRPRFHFSAPVGWLNDPNGFSFYNGRIHLFFQYYPYAARWSYMYWGHAVTDDFLVWDILPPALAPDEPYDAAGCFSGTALIRDDAQLLFYTGVAGTLDEDGLPHGPQQQCLASGRGLSYTKSAANPVIPTAMLPSGYRAADFRDPKVWEENGRLWLLAAAAREDGLGSLLLYTGRGPEEWSFHSVLLENTGRFGTMWECPDLFRLSGTDIVLVSIIAMPEDDPVLHSGSPVAAFLGKTGADRHFSWDTVTALDAGRDFYAPETLQMPDGRRVLIGWMQCPHNLPAPASFGWQGMMTFPRELFMEEGRLKMRPAGEIADAYADSVELHGQVSGKQTFPGISGRCIDLRIQVKEMHGSSFSVFLAEYGDKAAVLTWDPAARTLTFDRSAFESSAHEDAWPVQTFPAGDGNLDIRILLDLYSAEIFTGGGAVVFSAIFYPPPEARDISFACSGTACIHLEKHTVDPRSRV